MNIPDTIGEYQKFPDGADVVRFLGRLGKLLKDAYGFVEGHMKGPSTPVST